MTREISKNADKKYSDLSLDQDFVRRAQIQRPDLDPMDAVSVSLNSIVKDFKKDIDDVVNQEKQTKDLRNRFQDLSKRYSDIQKDNAEMHDEIERIQQLAGNFNDNTETEKLLAKVRDDLENKPGITDSQIKELEEKIKTAGDNRDAYEELKNIVDSLSKQNKISTEEYNKLMRDFNEKEKRFQSNMFKNRTEYEKLDKKYNSFEKEFAKKTANINKDLERIDIDSVNRYLDRIERQQLTNKKSINMIGREVQQNASQDRRQDKQLDVHDSAISQISQDLRSQYNQRKQTFEQQIDNLAETILGSQYSKYLK